MWIWNNLGEMWFQINYTSVNALMLEKNSQKSNSSCVVIVYVEQQLKKKINYYFRSSIILNNNNFKLSNANVTLK